MSDHLWKFIEKLEKHGHSLYSNLQGEYALADDSGRWPHETDDGPIWLDIRRMREEGLTLFLEDRPAGFTIPCRRATPHSYRGGECRTGTGLTGATKLAARFGVKLYVADKYGCVAKVTP